MRYILILLLFISGAASAQFAPTSAKSKFSNGIAIGSKDTSAFSAADTMVLTIARDSVMYYKYRGVWRPIATGGNLNNYKLISDTLFNNGYTTRGRTKQGLDSLGVLKLNISDTASMLANRLKISDTLTMLSRLSLDRVLANGNTSGRGVVLGTGSFTSSGSSNTVEIAHSSGSGIALNITKGGNGEGLYVNKTSGSGNAATIIGTLNATTLVKSGGLSTEFLKADGSVDATSYKSISDTFFTNGYTTRARTKQYGDSIAALKLNISDSATYFNQVVRTFGPQTVGGNKTFTSPTNITATGATALTVKGSSNKVQEWLDGSDRVRMSLGDIGSLTGSALKVGGLDRTQGAEIALTQTVVTDRDYGMYFLVKPTTSDIDWVVRSANADYVATRVYNDDRHILLNNSVNVNGRIFSTNLTNNKISSTNGSMEMFYNTTTGAGVLQSYNYTTASLRPLTISADNITMAVDTTIFSGRMVANFTGVGLNLNRTDGGSAHQAFSRSGTVTSYLGSSAANNFTVYNGSAVSMASFDAGALTLSAGLSATTAAFSSTLSAGASTLGATSITASSTPLIANRTDGNSAHIDLRRSGTSTAFLGTSGTSNFTVFNAAASPMLSITSGAATLTGSQTINTSSGIPLDLNRTDGSDIIISLRKSGTINSYFGTTGSNNFTLYNASAAAMATFSSGALTLTGGIAANGYTFGQRTRTLNTTLATSDDYLLMNTFSTTATLPDATTMAGKRFVVKAGAGTVTTIATTSSQTIDGIAASNFSLTGNNQNSLVVWSDGSNWQTENYINYSSGIYLPTATNVSNTSSITVDTAQYIRVGNVVTVSGRIAFTNTLNSPSEISITLPIATVVSSVRNVAGTANENIAEKVGIIRGRTGTNDALLEINGLNSSSYTVYYQYTYRIL